MIKILVIEDEEPMRANNVQILEFERTSMPFPWIMGVQLAQEHLPDLTLRHNDARNGWLRCANGALRQNPATAAIPFILPPLKQQPISAKEWNWEPMIILLSRLPQMN